MHERLGDFLDVLRREGELVEVTAPVNPYLEIAEIHRRVIAEQGPALLFRRVEGSSFPIVTNLFGTMRRVELAFGTRPEQFVTDAVRFVQSFGQGALRELWGMRHRAVDVLRLGTSSVRRAPILYRSIAHQPLRSVPVITSWAGDGGPFITLPLVYTEHPTTRTHNLGMYRMHVFDASTTGMHWQIHKGGGFHYAEAERRGIPLPVTAYIGGPPSLIVAAIAPLPENVPELLLTSLLIGKRLRTVRNPHGGHRLIAEAEFAIEGVVQPHERRMEGPFGDHYGYYSLAHPFPVLRIQRMWHRKDAVYAATVVGKPRQEDYFIGEYLQKLLSPLFPLVMPSVRDLWTYAESGFHPLAAAVVSERYSREALTAALRILGEGQLTLTKVLFVTDAPVSLQRFDEVLTAVLARMDPACDVRVLAQTAHDTLDYTGDRLNHGSKVILIGVGPQKRTLPPTLPPGIAHIGVRSAHMYVPGCAVVSGPSYVADPHYARTLVDAWRALSEECPLVIVVDDVQATVRDRQSFLWTVFTRFDPASDMWAHTEPHRHHVSYAWPIVIDARMKPGYPEELFTHDAVKDRVDARMHTLFDRGLMKAGRQ
jgi:UbiD family decarboxylase